MQIDDTIRREIQSALQATCERHRIRLLHACESGSRAWGFASPDSDYDVRLIYCREAEEYLRVFEHRECIEDQITGDLDLSGWDLKKTLRLIAKSNAVVFEWLQSRIVYGGEATAREKLWEVSQVYFQPKKCIHHYLGTVRSSMATIQADGIRIKKYFYVLRPLLAAFWIAERQTVPPMEFSDLRAMLENHPHIQSIIDELLEEKAKRAEGYMIPLRPELQAFIATIEAHCEAKSRTMEKSVADTGRLDQVFRELIG